MNATRLSCSRLIAASIALAACAGDTAPPRKLTGLDVSPPVWGVLEVPSTPGPHAAVILIPGSAGWRPDYARFAKTFADSGFVALAIDYYAAAPRETSPADGNTKWLVWQATIRNAVAVVDSLPSVAPNRIALVGYSRGAFLAVSVASSIPKVAAVVDFYGGGPAESGDEKSWRFPPLLILHGDADKDVSVDLAHLLRNEVVAHGGTVEMHIYPGAKHAFNGPWAWAYSERDAADSWGRTIEFLRRQLAH